MSGQHFGLSIASTVDVICALGRFDVPIGLTIDDRLALSLETHGNPYHRYLGIIVITFTRGLDELDHLGLESAIVSQRLIVMTRTWNLECKSVGIILHPGW